MSAQKLWYIRRGEKINGPFPRQTVSDYLLIGRFRYEDEGSLDRINWQPLAAWAEFDLPAPSGEKVAVGAMDWQLERLAAAKRWADERMFEDRRVRANPASSERRGNDRRENPEPPEMPALRALRAELRSAPQPQRNYRTLIALLGSLVGLTILATFLFNPVNPVKVDLASGKPECAGRAAPNINWMGCDKSGAWLEAADLNGANLAWAKLNSARLMRANLTYADMRQADLSFSDLSGAQLLGANLSQANFSHADLRGAKLTRAELRDAVFEEALLGGAVWVDGRVCAAESVGRCD